MTFNEMTQTYKELLDHTEEILEISGLSLCAVSVAIGHL